MARPNGEQATPYATVCQITKKISGAGGAVTLVVGHIQTTGESAQYRELRLNPKRTCDRWIFPASHNWDAQPGSCSQSRLPLQYSVCRLKRCREKEGKRRSRSWSRGCVQLPPFQLFACALVLSVWWSSSAAVLHYYVLRDFGATRRQNNPPSCGAQQEMAGRVGWRRAESATHETDHAIRSLRGQ